MALAYEDENRKRKALMGQMTDSPTQLTEAIPGQGAAMPSAPPVPTGGNMTFDKAIQRGYKEDTANPGHALMNSGSGPTKEENAAFRAANGTPESWAEVDRLSGLQGAEGSDSSMPPLPTEPPPLPGDDRQQPTTPGLTPEFKGDFSRLTGYDKEKFDANKDDAKYQIGRTLSGFDPRQGITPEVLAALNALGYGNFSGSGQRLSLKGLTDKGRAANLQGDYEGADFIQGFSGGNGKWAYADPVEEAKQASMAGGSGGGIDGTPGTYSDTSGDYPPEMQAALNGGGVPTDNAYFMKLLDQLQKASGPESTNRKALMTLMKQ